MMMICDVNHDSDVKLNLFLTQQPLAKKSQNVRNKSKEANGAFFQDFNNSLRVGQNLAVKVSLCRRTTRDSEFDGLMTKHEPFEASFNPEQVQSHNKLLNFLDSFGCPQFVSTFNVQLSEQLVKAAELRPDSNG